MNKILLTLCACALTVRAAFAADPALTIYNQNFAVVRDTVPLDLKEGVNDVSFADTTAHLEPDSVILRDPSGKVNLQVLEQNYRNDPVSQELLLSLFEGQTIDFLVKQTDKPDETIQGKIIRSGYMAHSQVAMQQYGQRYYQSQYNNGGTSQPVIEVDGKIQFGLPGQPIFPSLGDDTILKPTLTWKLNADAPGKLDAELAYITGGMSWEADYNVIAPENSDLLDIVGWVTMDNQSGKTFENAKIKLMAGDVNKIQNQNPMMMDMAVSTPTSVAAPVPGVTQKAFEDYHLYSLPRPTTLHDGETKQVEFIHAIGVKSEKIYVYDGLKVDWNQYNGWNMMNIRGNEEFGTDSGTKVAIMREFKNSVENHLGMPLPKGRLRFYKQDENQLEFTGENVINHTPQDELVKVNTGNAFDLVGQRTRTNFRIDNANSNADESFEIKLHNHKKDQVEIRVVEHLYRWTNWSITQQSDPFVKTDAQEIEFRVQLKPDEEKTLTYTVHYLW
ncbi:MAG: hypothetical protein LV480_12055 [Methylacidiphilales bacterium]|nr:hypothetical protein [Candidatus Methylacidiphilales bacterium]